ncbi:Egln3 [Symbiodinium natans]|uniref:Egln3 protein n=1 Tax=Symbiodinium natans TaxID=878477 RepID=A0A812UQG6_9DINO|nr:Egln3 [Symbiodinium natans]
MPGKKARGPTLRAATAKTDALREAGRGLLEKLEDQVQSLTKMADENLEQGLLGHYAEAMKMRSSAEQTLKELKRKLGLPVEGPPTDEPKDATPRLEEVNAEPAAQSEQRAPREPSLQPEPAPEQSGKPPAGSEKGATSQCALTPGGAKTSPLMPRYTWLPAEGDGCVLEILGPCSASSGSDASAAEVPDVDISDGAVRCRWEKSGWQLTLPVGFRVDQARCSVVRRPQVAWSSIWRSRQRRLRPSTSAQRSPAEALAGTMGFSLQLKQTQCGPGCWNSGRAVSYSRGRWRAASGRRSGQTATSSWRRATPSSQLSPGDWIASSSAWRRRFPSSRAFGSCAVGPWLLSTPAPGRATRHTSTAWRATTGGRSRASCT